MTPDNSRKGLENRKVDHIQLCAEEDVSFRQKTNLIEEVELIHNALPELSLDEIDLRTNFAGVTLKAPLIIAAMTGGAKEAETINLALAAAAQKFGIGFAFGSQRPMLSGITSGYDIRSVAPDALVLGNLGIVQAAQTPSNKIQDLISRSGADAICLHLNPAMEVVQPEGDKDFRGGLDTIKRLLDELSVPVIIKETGCGLSRQVGERIGRLGVKWVDVSGAGGTSWVGVEAHRAKAHQHRRQQVLGETYWDWGIPTAASVLQLSSQPLGICATGGLSSGLDVAKMIAIGATCGGIARTFLQALYQGGPSALDTKIAEVIDEIRIAHLLTGSRTPAELRLTPKILGPTLKQWAGI